MARTKNLSPDANVEAVSFRVPASTLAFLDAKVAEFQAKNPGHTTGRHLIARHMLMAAVAAQLAADEASV